MISRYLLVLVSLNPDRTDCGGNIYPLSGHIEADSYQPNFNILHGLYGTAWGQYKTSKWLQDGEDNCWCVLRIERNDDIILLDKDEALIKFKSGMVIFTGDKRGCEEYVANNRPNDAGAFGFKRVMSPQDELVLELA